LVPPVLDHVEVIGEASTFVLNRVDASPMTST